MSNLEPSIAEWRQQMSSGLRNSETLDELESHLREEFDVLSRAGIPAPDAFELARRRIGGVHLLESEFALARLNPLEVIMKKIMLIIAGIIGVLVGMAFVMPAVALWRNAGGLAAADTLLLALGLVLTLGGVGTAAFAARRRHAQ